MTVREAEQILGLPNGQAQLDAKGTPEEQRELFLQIKEDARRAYRRRAKRLHPDVQGDHEAMIELTEARDKILEATLQPREQPVVSVVRVWSATGMSTVNMTGTGTDAASPWGW